MRVPKSIILLAFLTQAAVVQSQALPLGQRIRVILPDSSIYVGRLDSAQAARIWVTPKQSAPRALDLSRIKQLQVSKGRKSKFLLGAGLGAALGLVSGLVLESVLEKGVPSDDRPPEALYAGVGAAGGALAGLALSAAFASERWETVPQPGSP
jgi:hypothetical protein